LFATTLAPVAGDNLVTFDDLEIIVRD